MRFMTVAEGSVVEDENSQPKIKAFKIKGNLNFIIHYVEQSTNENISYYCDHLEHSCELLV